MYYLVDSDKSFEQAAVDLDAAVRRQGFGVLHVHDLQNRSWCRRPAHDNGSPGWDRQ